MNRLPTVAASTSAKARQYGGKPALFFDKQPIDSGPDLELLTIAEVAEFLRISVAGVRRLQQQRRIPFVKIGGSIRFAKNDIAFFVAQNRVEAIGS